MKPICICIHGHFYQPPRENAWIDDIEQQESAYPFHDWNERIYHECYRPNSRSRIFNDRGQIIGIVNNFERMSFNIGPTLMSWLQVKHPKTYESIIRADKLSCAAHHGHGNALAQVYNHMIMPLANRRDKVTQVRWGLADFKRRFGRDAEGMWLAETAVNEETLEILAAEGVRFTILAPHQAEAVRLISGDEKMPWQEVPHGSIDPRRPYRCYIKKDPARYVDIFFYDGPISKSVAFDDLLKDAKHLMTRLESAVRPDEAEPQLIHIAADGETFGHHKSWGDQALAYLLFHEAEARGYRLVNYAEFLAENPPRYEVRLKAGENGEGTSWSCAHGVRRWKQHCGCRGDGPADWRQDWRKPLRDALDWLRDQLAGHYEKSCVGLLKDPWQARNEYVRLVLDRSENQIQDFFDMHAVKKLAPHEVSLCLKLLEMQRYAMLMYTSCGWFFTEISGIETVQIMQYAARACQLAQQTEGSGFEEDFLTRLAEAKSNVPALKDARGVYEQLVRPRVASSQHMVGYYAIGAIFENYYPQAETLDLYCFQLTVVHRRKEVFGNLIVHAGRVKVRSRITLEEHDCVFAAVQIGLYDFRCSMKPFQHDRHYEKLETAVFEGLHGLHLFDFLKKMDDLFGESSFGLKDLLLEDRLKTVSILTQSQIEKVSRFYERIYEENRPMHAIYGNVNLPVPEEFRYAAEHVLSRRLNELVRGWFDQGFSLRKALPIHQLMETARSYRVKVNTKETGLFMAGELVRRIREFAVKLDPKLIRDCVNIHKVARQLDLELDCQAGQDDLFFLMKNWSSGEVPLPDFILPHWDLLILLMRRLGLSVQGFRKAVVSKANLN
ncbi:MAG: DUF3536 domain-containing protein [Candidatus Omnitrophica bacterium]|nr:DUF3536 domain-containing protein [Candidatus Omnitrophota bacterium]